jgi:hypothetical protein
MQSIANAKMKIKCYNNLSAFICGKSLLKHQATSNN